MKYFYHFISDPIVRSELMEQIPHIAVYCHDNIDIFQNAIPMYILPMVVRYLDDANNQVSIHPSIEYYKSTKYIFIHIKWRMSNVDSNVNKKLSVLLSSDL